MAPAEVLRACPLFKGFTDTGLQILSSIASARAFERGATLFSENDRGEGLLVLASGKVQLRSSNLAGTSIEVGIAAAPEALGELSLIHQGPRMCTATALGNVQALEIRHAEFQKLMAQKPQACIKLLMAIASGLGEKLVANRQALKGLLPKR